MKPFTPAPAGTSSIAATTSSGLRAAIRQQPTGSHQLRLFNAGPNTAFWTFGDGAVSATTADIPLPAGAIEVVTLSNPSGAPTSHVSAITASGTATLYLTTGQGL